MIEKIEIKNFRSIYHVSLKGIDNINVFTGKNDTGKSNILRALNLFFNNCIAKPGDFTFSKNYNYKRLEEVRQETIKGRQFIQIKVTFNRGDQYKTLPQRFTVTKKWTRDSDTPEMYDDVEARLRKEGRPLSGRTRQMLNRYLNSINYIYVSAIKDTETFNNLLQYLQTTVFDKALSTNQDIVKTMHKISDTMANYTEELSDEFRKATNIESRVSTPRSIERLYNTFHVDTSTQNGDIPIEDRGDGIQARYIPAILNYISTKSKGKYIWGFEEPENSLEFNMAREMAKDFFEEYSNNSDIFITTHSPAFIDLANKTGGSGYRCYKDDNETKAVAFRNESDNMALSEELGYAYIQMEQYESLKKQIERNESLKNRVNELSDQINNMTKPVVLTEGKTDAIILKTAWEKLYSEEMPFEIKSCSVTNENEGTSTAGVDMLRKIMTSVMHDQPNISIGVFDNDKEGQSAFNKLGNNYISVSGKPWKQHKNEKGYAMMLPCDSDTEIIAEKHQLAIEKMFDYADINKEVGGKRLILETADIMINGIVVELDSVESEDSYWYLRKIDNNSKIDFALEVVPTLEKNSFRRFEPLFDSIIDIINNTY